MRYIVKQRGDMTQAELARRIGIPAPDMNRYECGKSNPTPEQAKAICLELGCTIGHLFDRSEWDYEYSPKRRRKSDKDKGVEKLTVRLTAGLASRVKEQCEEMGLSQAQYIQHCADLVDKQRGNHEK